MLLNLLGIKTYTAKTCVLIPQIRLAKKELVTE